MNEFAGRVDSNALPAFPVLPGAGRPADVIGVAPAGLQSRAVPRSRWDNPSKASLGSMNRCSRTNCFSDDPLDSLILVVAIYGHGTQTIRGSLPQFRAH
jgi:hypothetical protein